MTRATWRGLGLVAVALLAAAALTWLLWSPTAEHDCDCGFVDAPAR